MSLNKSKGNMYDFITHTWNPIKGKCYHDCSYCYMKRFGKQKPIRLDETEYKTDLGQDNLIFVGSSCDMFARDIPHDWIIKTLDRCEKYSGNYYLIQTKNPNNMFKFLYNRNKRIFKTCITVESNLHYTEIMGKSPSPIDRTYAYIDYITIEPILDFDIDLFISMLESCKPKQINIGADSGNNNLPEPPKEKILELITELKKFTKVKLKKNLNRLIKDGKKNMNARIRRVIRRRLRVQTIDDIEACSEAVNRGLMKSGNEEDAIPEVTKKGMEFINYEY